MTHLAELPTPCLVLDRRKMERNIARLNATVGDLGVALRPHVKTNKSAEISRLLVAGHAGGITVSTLAEARYFLDAGFVDMLYAVGIVPGKLAEVARLIDAGADLKIILDSCEMATQVAAFANAQGVVLKVLLELDCDGHRSGLDPDHPNLLKAAQILSESDGTEFVGVMTHAGSSYACPNVRSIRELAVHEWRTAGACAARLQDAGVDCPMVSVGSTPTTVFAEPVEGVTEVRAGVYVFFDLFQANLGVCKRREIALTVLTTVIGHKQSRNRLIIDAGALALSKDTGTGSQAQDCRYGLICNAATGEFVDGLIVDAVNQEHGIVVGTDADIDFARHPVGSMLRVLPIHACMTAAGHDQYHVVHDNDPTIEETWLRCRGW